MNKSGAMKIMLSDYIQLSLKENGGRLNSDNIDVEQYTHFSVMLIFLKNAKNVIVQFHCELTYFVPYQIWKKFKIV